MIGRPLIDFKRPIDLLQQHDPGQVMGKGHGGHGQRGPGPRFDRWVEAEGAADDEHDMAGSPYRQALHPPGKALRGQALSLYLQSADKGVLPDFLQETPCLFFLDLFLQGLTGPIGSFSRLLLPGIPACSICSVVSHIPK